MTTMTRKQVDAEIKVVVGRMVEIVALCDNTIAAVASCDTKEQAMTITKKFDAPAIKAEQTRLSARLRELKRLDALLSDIEQTKAEEEIQEVKTEKTSVRSVFPIKKLVIGAMVVVGLIGIVCCLASE